MLSDAVEANSDTISSQDGTDGFHLSVPPQIGVYAATAYGAALHFRSPAGSFKLSAEGHFVAVLLAASRELAIVVGDGNMAVSGDGLVATAASHMEPTGVVVDAAGRLYCATWRSGIRVVAPGP